jgi:hypothetical protein
VSRARPGGGQGFRVLRQLSRRHRLVLQRSGAFARGKAGEIVRHVRHALASIKALKDHLEECQIRKQLAAETTRTAARGTWHVARGT